MVPAEILNRLTAEQVREFRRLYRQDGEAFVQEHSDGTLTVVAGSHIKIETDVKSNEADFPPNWVAGPGVTISPADDDRPDMITITSGPVSDPPTIVAAATTMPRGNKKPHAP